MITEKKQMKIAAVNNDQHLPFIGKRHIQFTLWFFACFIAFGIRSNLSVEILAMMSDDPTVKDFETFPNWTMKNSMLSSFFWGYVIPQVAAGKIGQTFGPKWPLAYGMFVNAVVMFLMPLCVFNFGEIGVLVCRIIQGLHQSFLYPSIHCLADKWVPLSERSRVVGIVYSASSLGVFASMLITGEICEKLGWPYGFYFYGILGMLWVIFWVLFGSNSPKTHKGLSELERSYISEGKMEQKEEKPSRTSTPWLSIVTSLPVWAIFLAHCGYQWGFYTLLTETATYLKKIMNFDLQSSSILAGAPYLAFWFSNFLFSPIADWCINKNYLSIGATRKLFNSIGALGPGLALVWLAFVSPDQKVLAVVLLIVSVGLMAGLFSGFNCNHLDIAPNHAGVLMGITNGFSAILSILAPLFLDVIKLPEDDPELWKIVFLFAAGICIVSDVFFVMFGTGEIQSWNYNNEDDDNNKEDEHTNKV